MPVPLQATDALVHLGRSPSPITRWWAMERLGVQDPSRIEAWPSAHVGIPNALEVCRAAAVDATGPALVNTLALLDAGLLPEDPSSYVASLRATVAEAPRFVWEVLTKLGAVTRADLRAIQAEYGEQDPVFWVALLRLSPDEAQRAEVAAAIARAINALSPESAAAHIDAVLDGLAVPGPDTLETGFWGAVDTPEALFEVGAARATGRAAEPRARTTGSASTAVLRLTDRSLRGIAHPAATFLRACAAHRELAGPLGYLLPAVGWLASFRVAETPEGRLQGVLNRGDVDFMRRAEARRWLIERPLPAEVIGATPFWDLALTGAAGAEAAARWFPEEGYAPRALVPEWQIAANRYPEVAIAAIAGDFTRSRAAIAGSLPWEEALSAMLAWAPESPADQDWLAECLLRSCEQAALDKVDGFYSDREPPEEIRDAIAVAASVMGVGAS